ncbi:MAG TPA: thioredoxin [Bacteroidales bacterium]|nr:thioredoxin [Bacteroidales bacterium]
MKGLIIALVVVAALAFLVIRAWHKMKNTPVTEDSHLIEQLTDKNFNNKIKKDVVLVDFWADWCMPCRMMAPILNDVAESTEGEASVYKLNVDEYQQVASRYGIRNIPTMILFKDGKEFERLVGMKTKESLLSSIEKAKK